MIKELDIFIDDHPRIKVYILNTKYVCFLFPDIYIMITF